MKITKRQLRKIIREAYSRLLIEYGGQSGRVSWTEDPEHDVVFDIEGLEDEGPFTQDQVWEKAEEDESLYDDVRAAVDDWDDYQYSS